jgi:hypothetical protein
MSEREITFLLRDDSSEQISLRIRVSQLKAQIYTTLGSSLSKLSGGRPTLEDAVTFVKKKWPNSKSEAADYLVAANILDSAGNEDAASRAATLAFEADKSLETNPTSQLTFAVLKTKSGDSPGAQLAFERAAQTVPTTGTNPTTVRYFTGVADLRMGDWSSAKENLCSPETRGWAEGHTAWLEFGAKELAIPGVDRAVNSDSCNTNVLQIALDRTNPNDPEYGHIFSAMTNESNRHPQKF